MTDKNQSMFGRIIHVVYPRSLKRYFRKKLDRVKNLFIQKERVAMLHIGRCGSSVLGRMLNAHPDIYWAGEIFEEYTHTKNPDDKAKFVKRIFYPECHREVIRIFGFETKYLPQQHLSHKCINMELGDYINLLRKLNVTKYIVLHRKNYLRYVISFRVGAKTKTWHSKHKATSPQKLHIDVNNPRVERYGQTILELFRNIDNNYEELKNILSGDDTLYLTYEDDILQDPRIAYRKVCRFLDVPDEAPDIELQRTNPFTYREMVVNFDEVVSTLKGTNYSWMLDE